MPKKPEVELKKPTCQKEEGEIFDHIKADLSYQMLSSSNDAVMTLKFRIHYRVEYGQSISILGSSY